MDKGKLSSSNPENVDNSEKPSSVIADIVVKTLITLAIGLLVMYSGLI
ncbi:MAG: hypothetical protein GQF41_1180 [Candidatus Rifleibacterium amylolyticum]|nr:MAG: hypothetical protein GQF41_1180 [Candidatus Rifleibacterium amylolyticum]